ncbi:MAG: ferredoxin [Candidatus Nealsonbacteria bacterium]|nr:ferredoxin [Candidatus Nealsonbacteria bacterium]
MAKIILEQEKCIGCGTCQALCPKYWKMAEDGKAVMISEEGKEEKVEMEVKDISCNKDAADSCPVQCIRINDRNS